MSDFSIGSQDKSMEKQPLVKDDTTAHTHSHSHSHAAHSHADESSILKAHPGQICLLENDKEF
jgi:hypothetical protein